MDGVIVEAGSVPGVFVSADPLGRHVAAVDGGMLTTYDLVDGLATVGSWRLPRPRHLAVRPGGTAIAVVSARSALEVWCDGGRERSVAVDSGGWVAYTADGAYLLLGADGRLDLFDATTLELVDASGPLHRGTEPLVGWGEGVDVAYLTGKPTVVGFTANAGDDPHVLAVAAVHDGHLRVHGESFAQHVPGERVNSIALTDRELLVLDDDGNVSAFAWQKAGVARRLVADGFGGTLFARDGLAGLEVIDEDELVAIALLDIASGQRIGTVALPADWRHELAMLDNGFLRRTVDGRTWFARCL